MATPNPSMASEGNRVSRQLAILVSDCPGLHEQAQQLGDVETGRRTNRLLALQEVIVTRGGAGQVLPYGAHAFCAVFDKPSDALNRALEIQRVLNGGTTDGSLSALPSVRIGLHLGEVAFQQGTRVEIISRHLNRANKVMEAAAPGQIYATEAVIEAGRDFIDLPPDALALRHYGEYYLNEVGATHLCEVTDVRFRPPEPPRLTNQLQAEAALAGRLEMAGYSALARLGEGGNGVVYRATRTETGETVAVKVLAPAWNKVPSARQQLAADTARLQPLNLAGVVRRIEDCLDHHPPFLVMEWIDGQPLDVALQGAKPERIARVMQSVCQFLARIHSANLVHGDLKPENILLRADDVPVLTDFGMAALTGTSAVGTVSGAPLSGSIAYLAPEVIAGKPSGPAADLYALGAVLFKVLTGQEPFGDRSQHDLAQAQLYEDPPLPATVNPLVPDALQRICLKALEKNPAERYANAAAMAADLERFLAGAVVHTRPTAYDNLLYHRVQRHVDEVQAWSARGLLNEEESHRLLSAYEGLERRGIPAVMESRVYRLWQTLVYLGGWAVVNGALLWLVLHWDTLTRLQKLTLGSVPAITAFALAIAMMKLERFRLTFLALVVGIVAVPLVAGVWLHEFHVAAEVSEGSLTQELFYEGDRSVWLTNLQILMAAMATFAVAAGVMSYTRTITHSTQAMLAFALLYCAELLFFDLKAEWEAEHWAALSLQYVPLWLICAGVIGWLLRQPDRAHQAAPWIVFAAVLAIGITDVLAMHGLREWKQLDPMIRPPASFLLLSLAGVTQTGLGLWARKYLQHRGRLAVLILVVAGLSSVLAGLGLAGMSDYWPDTWWSPKLFGQAVPVVHLALPLVSLATALLACRFQMFTFLGLGLGGFAVSVHLLGELYFKAVSGWPKWIMILGAIGFIGALWMELKRTRGNAVGDAITQQRL